MATRRTAKRIGTIAAAVVAILVLVVALFDWKLLRGVVANQVSAWTDGNFAINGDLDLRWSWPPTVRAERISFSSTEPNSALRAAEVDVLEFRIDPWQLIKGKFALPSLSLVGPTVLVENRRTAKERPEEGEQGGMAEAVDIGRLSIRDGVIHYRDPAHDTALRATVSTQPPAAGRNESSLSVQVAGRYQGKRVEAEGQGGSLLSLRASEDPYPLDVRGRIGDTRIEARGTLADPLRLAGADIIAKLQGQDISDTASLLGFPAPATPPYSIGGHLRHQEGTWSLADFTGRLGDSRVAGDVALDTRGRKPLLRGDLRSDYLDLDDLAGFIGAPPKTGPGETASPEQREQAQAQARRPEVLPAKPYNTERLRAVDADVRFRATRIKAPAVEVNKLAGHLLLEDGKLTLKPLEFGVAGGTVRSEVAINAAEKELVAAVDATARQINLQRLFPDLEMTEESEGQFGGQAELTTRGRSFADLAAALDGDLSLIMSGGRVSNLLLEILGIDGGEALRFFLGGDENVPLRCAVIDFVIRDGAMKPDTFLIDTTDTNITAGGTIHLGKETLDLEFHATPKDPSIFSSRAPLYVKGSLKDPDFSVDKSTIAQRVGAAIALGVLVNPLAALAPLIETGPGKDTNCGALFAQANGKDEAKAH